VQLLQEAVREFEGTSEEVSIVVADCEASIAGGDVSGALQRLKSVPETSPHYVRACVAMAAIHLEHRKDSAAYIQCYLHLVVRLLGFLLARARGMHLCHCKSRSVLPGHKRKG
jgi:hypothetical protein